MNKERINDLSIIDCHTHASGIDAYNFFIPRLPSTHSVAELERKIIDNKISYCIVFPMPFTLYYDPKEAVCNNKLQPSGLEDFPYQTENKALLHEVNFSSKSKCFFPFLAIDPNEKVNEQMNFLKEEKNYFGLKLHTVATNSSLKDFEYSPFLELLKKRNMPLMIHSGKTEESSSNYVFSFAERHPDVRVCIAHLAGFDKDILTRIKKTKNIFIDTSPFLSCCYLADKKDKRYLSSNSLNLEFYDPIRVLSSVNSMLKGHLIWGTDEPWTLLTDPTTGYMIVGNSYKKECQLLKDLDKKGFSDIKYEISNKNIRLFLGIE